MEAINKKVSVIIPCYNGENYIDRSINSIYQQNYKNIELIIVDDGSTDGSREKILNWENVCKHKGISFTYIHQSNKGSGGAVDTGLKYVSGEYLTLLDADDRFLEDSIQKRVNYLEEHPECAGVRSNGWYVQGKDRTLFVVEEEEKTTTDVFTALTFGKTNNWAGTYMIRTSILFDIYPDRNIFPSRFGQNFQILLPVSYNRIFGFIDEPLVEYYINDNSHSHSDDKEKSYIIGENNALGWREIYIDVLSRVEKDPFEYQRFLNGYNSVYYRGGMFRAIKHQKYENLQSYYKLLVSTGLATINDHITFYTAVHSFKVIPLKIIRRIRKLLFKRN